MVGYRKNLLIMNIVGFPGINPQTEQWIKDLIQALDLGHTSTYVHRYHHWDNPGTKMNLDNELASIAKEEVDVVIAKSVGVVLALTGKAKGLIVSKSYIFIGTPVSGMHERNLKYLKGLVNAIEPCLFIQQRDDRAGSFKALQQYITQSSLIELVDIPGSDHKYAEIHLLKKIIEMWYENCGL